MEATTVTRLITSTDDDSTDDILEPLSPLLRHFKKLNITCIKKAMSTLVEQSNNGYQESDISIYIRYGEMKAAKNKKLLEDTGMTTSEAVAIYLYTVDGLETNDGRKFFRQLNSLLLLRKRDPLLPWGPYLVLFLSGLGCLPPVTGAVVWRGVSAQLDTSVKYRKSDPPDDVNEITWAAFTSTTTQVGVLDNFLKPTDPWHTQFMVEQAVGYDISPLSSYSNESEVLILPCSTFKVKGNRNSHNSSIIHLQQLPDIDDFFAPLGKKSPWTQQPAVHQSHPSPSASTTAHSHTTTHNHTGQHPDSVPAHGAGGNGSHSEGKAPTTPGVTDGQPVQPENGQHPIPHAATVHGEESCGTVATPATPGGGGNGGGSDHSPVDEGEAPTAPGVSGGQSVQSGNHTWGGQHAVPDPTTVHGEASSGTVATPATPGGGGNGGGFNHSPVDEGEAPTTPGVSGGQLDGQHPNPTPVHGEANTDSVGTTNIPEVSGAQDVGSQLLQPQDATEQGMVHVQ
eukprot:TRINITY_DN65538_c3_g1_i2.p1 TRINITY_DN65538_c3_g1~~TRINITY_DN65538_c3_g1_i2.p1  ORF type:complete len:530 (-),score=34.13 TRINITY_DN65538_c3_g1_i2:69-1598(-)